MVCKYCHLYLLLLLVLTNVTVTDLDAFADQFNPDWHVKRHTLSSWARHHSFACRWTVRFYHLGSGSMGSLWGSDRKRGVVTQHLQMGECSARSGAFERTVIRAKGWWWSAPKWNAKLKCHAFSKPFLTETNIHVFFSWIFMALDLISGCKWSEQIFLNAQLPVAPVFCGGGKRQISAETIQEAGLWTSTGDDFFITCSFYSCKYRFVC